MDDQNTTPEGEQQDPKVFVNEQPAEEYQKEMEAKPAPESTPEPQEETEPVQETPAEPEPTPEPTPEPEKPKLTPEQTKELKVKKKKVKKKKAIMAMAITGGVVAVVIIVMIFLLLVQGGGSNNPLLQMFGISEDNFFPFLISLTNIIFGLVIFIAFIVGVIGVFKASMTKKEDKAGKKKSIIMASIGGFAVLVLAFAWGFTYMYLSSQYTETQEAQDTSLIQTVPEELTDLTAPLTIEFDASNIPFNPYQYQIISYEWNFGDGSTATGESVSHRYTQKGPDAGRYEVILDITYEDLNTGEEAVEELILDVVFSNEQVTASFTATPQEGGIPLEVQFDASESVDPDGEIVAYEWDLDGDGKYDDGEGVEASYTYEQAGSYEVELRITDNNGEYSLTSLTIEAGTTVPVAVITEPTSEYYEDIEYTFSAADSDSPNGDIESYVWDFGDGSSEIKTKTAKHTYSSPGTYNLTLTLTDEEGFEGSKSITIVVDTPSEKPTAVIVTDPDLDEEENAVVGEAPYVVIFDATATGDPDNNIIEYEWDLDGDGISDDTGETATYTYSEEGTYIAELTVIDADGNEDTETVVIIIEAQGLKTTLMVSPVSGEVPLQVEFNASGSTYPGSEIVAYEWDFGDGSAEYLGGAEVDYEYDEIGTFEASVTAIAADGLEDTATMSITVRPVSLAACFEANVEEGPAPLIVTFDPTCSQGAIQSYSWDFGDGEMSYDTKPTHTYDEVGVYTVTLEVEELSGVSDSFEGSIVVSGESD